jgi:hypothetical protein
VWDLITEPMHIHFGSLSDWTPVAIVIAAGIAALYARWNHKEQLGDAQVRLEKQLRAENARHERQLDTAAERLTRQLGHDRDMRDRDALRNTLDDVSRGLIKALDSCIRAESTLRVFESTLTGAEDGQSDAAARYRKRADRRIRKARKAVAELAPTSAQLRIRLDPENSIVRAHWDMREALIRWKNELLLSDASRSNHALALAENARRDSTALLIAFNESCRLHFASRGRASGA